MLFFASFHFMFFSVPAKSQLVFRHLHLVSFSSLRIGNLYSWLRNLLCIANVLSLKKERRHDTRKFSDLRLDKLKKLFLFFISKFDLFKYGPIPASFSLISSFSHSNFNYNFNHTNWKSVNGVHGSGSELWRPTKLDLFSPKIFLEWRIFRSSLLDFQKSQKVLS